MPVTPIIGVRISWLIAARNVDFARLACSAELARRGGLRRASSRAAMSDCIAAAISLNRAATLLELGGARISPAAVVAAGDPPRRRDELPSGRSAIRASRSIAAATAITISARLAICAAEQRVVVRPRAFDVARRARLDEPDEALDCLHDRAASRAGSRVRRGAGSPAARRRRNPRRRRAMRRRDATHDVALDPREPVGRRSAAVSASNSACAKPRRTHLLR